MPAVASGTLAQLPRHTCMHRTEYLGKMLQAARPATAAHAAQALILLRATPLLTTCFACLCGGHTRGSACVTPNKLSRRLRSVGATWKAAALGACPLGASSSHEPTGAGCYNAPSLPKRRRAAPAGRSHPAVQRQAQSLGACCPCPAHATQRCILQRADASFTLPH